MRLQLKVQNRLMPHSFGKLSRVNLNLPHHEHGMSEKRKSKTTIIEPE